MAKKKDELGKGIRALLQGIDDEMPQESTPYNSTGVTVANIALEDIEVNPFQPRATFDEAALKDLANSIRVHGVIQPITVRIEEQGKYQLIAGERRLRASRLAGNATIPAYIREANDQEMLEIALIENIQREDLNSIEIALNYKRLIDDCDLKQDEMAERVGKERSTVTNYLRLLKLPPDVQAGIREDKISMGHARAIVNITDPVAQMIIFKSIVEQGLSVRKVEELVRGIKNRKPGQSAPSVKSGKGSKLSPEMNSVQERLKNQLGTKVALKTKGKESGEIVISWYTNDDLDRILETIGYD